MAVTLEYGNNSPSALSLDTPTELASTGGTNNLATGKTYVLVVDLKNMVNADIVVIRVKAKAYTSGTEGNAYSATYAHAQADDIVFSVPIPTAVYTKFEIEQTDGTGRAFPWAVYSL